MLELQFLGSLETRLQGETVAFPTQKSALLLAYLVTFRDRAHPRSALAERFWGEASPRRANNSLRSALTALRKCLPVPGSEPPYLITTVTSVRFNESAPFTLDTQVLEEALTLLARAAEAFEQLPSDGETLALRLHLHTQRARVHALRSDLDAQRAAVGALEALARASGAVSAQLRVHLHRSYWAQLAERREEALEHAEALRVLAKREGDKTFQAAALRRRGRLREHRGEYVPALADQRRTARLAPDLPPVVAGVPLPDRTGVLHSYLGQFDKALDHYTEQRARLGSSADPFAQIDLGINLGITLEHLGDHAGAIAHYRRGRALAAQLGDTIAENGTAGGISVSGNGKLALEESTVVENVFVGVWVGENAQATIADNEISRNTQRASGIALLHTAQVKISGNIIQRNAGCGVGLFEDRGISISGQDNAIRSNGRDLCGPTRKFPLGFGGGR